MNSILSGEDENKPSNGVLEGISTPPGAVSGDLSARGSDGLLSGAYVAPCVPGGASADSVATSERTGPAALGKYTGDLRPNIPVESITDPASEADLKAIVNRTSRYAKRGIWQEYSSQKSIATCGYPSPGGDVAIRNFKGVRHYQGVNRCKSSWLCPVCAAVLRNGRSQEVSKAVLRAINELGWSAYLVTRTIQHNKHDRLRDLMALQSKCKRSVDSNGTVKRLYELLGYKGAITAKEVTYTYANGWHVHTHELHLYSKRLTDEELVKLQKSLYVASNNFYMKHGHKKLSASKGIDIQEVTSNADAVSAYLQKIDGGFNAHNELTRIDLKKGRGGSRTIFQVLEDFCNSPNSDDYDLLIEYEDATKGNHVLHWKQGLRDILLPQEKELTDEELIEIEIGGFEEIIMQSWYFKRIKRARLDGVILASLQLGGIPCMVSTLEQHEMHNPDGYTVCELSNEEIEDQKITAFHLKLKRLVKIEDNKQVARKHAKDASDAMYLNFIRRHAEKLPNP